MWRVLVSLGLVVLFLLIIMAFSAKSAGIPSPLSEVKGTIEGLKKVVIDPTLKSSSNKALRHERIRGLIFERINFDEMAKRSLGTHWKSIRDSEKIEYVSVFSKLVDVFYRTTLFTSVEFINSIDIKYGNERIDGDFAEVEIKIPDSPNDIKILLKMSLVGGHWKAYDIIIDNISTVQNWRSQFDRILQKKSFSEFLKQLKDKIEELEEKNS